MRKKFSLYEKKQGELAIHYLSEKAFDYYNNTDPLEVYEYKIYDPNSDEDQTLYAYKEGGEMVADGLTFKELEKEFEEMYDILTENEEEYI